MRQCATDHGRHLFLVILGRRNVQRGNAFHIEGLAESLNALKHTQEMRKKAVEKGPA